MTNWKINLTDTEYATFARTEQQTLIRPRFDVQRGDGAAIYRDGTWMAGLEVIHVAQNVPGVEAGHLVITFRNRRLEAAERAADARLEHVGRLARSNAALRGQITRLRNRLAEVTPS
ncbi:hypothetical protein SEA_ZIPP_62 [Gordonia phage Zipp]|uniref:ASC-1 transcription coactivator n=4 Tax=Zitchvirus TaxID=2948963 RepID=A0A976YES7_9CAUD|nr:hypothetical protein J1775_gp62 [Gordonia phage Zipp]QDH93215.1 hypothetical protein SEA_ZIPP_62 [Gordonia phage Zipp]UTN91800.1 ASC-1 transcription coactivator [Gordonia Phage Sampson]UVF61683.1 ASC-1 transcription coactivator [Gordonia phage APunk]UVG35024.1 ASC-1 transcription coactivator [Gordonia phage ViaConlectus]